MKRPNKEYYRKKKNLSSYTTDLEMYCNALEEENQKLLEDNIKLTNRLAHYEMKSEVSVI